MTITTNFEDLDVGAYYYSAVVWANFHGIVNGTSDTTFSPNDFITREQLAVILYRYATYQGYDVSQRADLSGFVVPDEFVVGYGLDYCQQYRNMPYIGVLKPEVYSK